ncbi:hypothetical protein [Geodermatophilus sabuli]|uniref:Uncharacterized protein n=1 Tax=Geodermatophilus sabuli TaxID=1564158 RepID=A0A285EFV3_9ACTN|nr:hypothetical protein [Geodermatophilus sabuli]MBB3084728.1 hypothetical protein [Geodermatophilus sabuli]SNX97084.1 hypothetical protein SAMN06893097_10633 [Geodermatophilus sabuli]
MSRSLSVRVLGAPLAVAALLLAGCGASEDEERQAAFCEDVPDLLSDVTAELEAVSAEPEQAPGIVGDAVERLEAVDPPEDVADEWQDLVTAWSGMRDLLGEVDLTDPSANTEFVGEATQVQEDLVATGSAVDEWSQANC